MRNKVESREIITLKEWETTLNPVCLTLKEANFLENNFQREIRLTPTRIQDHYVLSARQYIGAIVFGEKEINILPKINNSNIFYMLSYTLGLPNFQEGLTGHITSEGIFEVVIWYFSRQLETLLTRGLYKNYKEVEENRAFIKGQLVVNESLRQNLANKHLNICRYSEFTEDVLENRILKYAISILLGKRYRNKLVRQSLYHCFLQMEQVGLTVINSHIFNSLAYTRLNNHYKGIHSLARFFIENTSITNDKGQMKISSFLLDMNKLFEDFVRAYLKEQLEKIPDIKVQKRREWLDTEKRIKIIPDIVITRKGRPVLVLDTKYKRLVKDEVKHVDIYQIYAYCNVLGVGSGLLVYGEGEGCKYQAKVPTGLGIETVILELGGNYTELIGECNRLIRRISKELYWQYG